MKIGVLFMICSTWIGACTQVSNSDKSTVAIESEDDFRVLNESLDSRAHLFLSYPLDSTKFPRSLETNGEVRGVPSKDWCSGFFPGSLLHLYKITGDKLFLDRAEIWLPYLAKEQWNGITHDMGFKVYCSIGNAYKITGKQSYKKVLIQAAKTLSSRYDPIVGCIKSWDFGGDRWTYPVIIDNMMNLELLFEATKLTGDSSFYKIADSHAKHTMINQYRPDNSCFHVIDYDQETGEVAQQLTHQGYDVNSVWSRGQSWGFYGFTMAYRYTNNENYLNHAKKIFEFVIGQANMPEDLVPFWDMKDPSIPESPRDASAAAVMASAALELYEHTKDEKYKTYAQSVIETLSSSNYVLDSIYQVPFLLGHSTGDWPKNDAIDASLSYADYYFLEAISREKEIAEKLKKQ